MAGRPGRPPSGLVRSNPSPAATDPEGGTRRLFRRLRVRVGRAERRARFRFVAGKARLPMAHGFVRVGWVEGSLTSSAPTTARISRVEDATPSPKRHALPCRSARCARIRYTAAPAALRSGRRRRGTEGAARRLFAPHRTPRKINRYGEGDPSPVIRDEPKKTGCRGNDIPWRQRPHLVDTPGPRSEPRGFRHVLRDILRCASGLCATSVSPAPTCSLHGPCHVRFVAARRYRGFRLSACRA
ncbi:hypothetical protein ACVKN3_000393 [Luteibacter sp. PvP120]